MKLRSIYALFTLLLVINLAPVSAQQKKNKKQVKKTSQTANKAIAKKPASKKALAVKSKIIVKPKTAATRLGDEAAKTAADTTKGGKSNTSQNKNSTLTEEVVVTTAYKPVLADAVKIRRNPTLEDTVPYKAPLSYVTLDKRLDKDSEIRQLSAMKMPASRDSDYKKNYVTLGAGSLKTLFGEAYFNNGPDAALQAGGFLKHFSQSGTLYKQNYSTNEAGVFGKTVGDVNALSGKIDFKNIGTSFYGYDVANPPVTLNVAKQHFNILSAEGELAKNYKDVQNDFTYALKLNGYVYSDAYQARENNLVLSGFINETVNQFYAGLAGSLDLSTQKDSLYNHNNSLLRLNPYLKFQGDNYKIDAGVNIVKEFGFSSRFFVLPAAKLEYQVIPKYVRLFVEAKGDVNRTSIYDFAMINPYIDHDLAIKNSVDKLDLAAGLKGTLAPGLSFKADVFRNSVENLPLLVSQYSSQNNNRFGVIYDNGTATVTGFNGELDFKESDDFNLYGRVEFKDYKLASEAQPWNLPKFKMTAGTAIHITDKVVINAALVIRGSVDDRVINNSPFANSTPKVVSLSSYADLNGGVEYRITNKISIFGQVNNLLNTNYQVWLYYPNYGFNVFGGAKFSF